MLFSPAKRLTTWNSWFGGCHDVLYQYQTYSLTVVRVEPIGAECWARLPWEATWCWCWLVDWWEGHRAPRRGWSSTRWSCKHSGTSKHFQSNTHRYMMSRLILKQTMNNIVRKNISWNLMNSSSVASKCSVVQDSGWAFLLLKLTSKFQDPAELRPIFNFSPPTENPCRKL